MTPNLAVALNAQRTQRAEDIFGQVQPIKLEGKSAIGWKTALYPRPCLFRLFQG
jgi:hypothetical protein